MKRKAIWLIAVELFGGALVFAQKADKNILHSPTSGQPATNLADELAQRLGQELHGQTVVGQPIKAGTVTLIPILMVDISFAGGAVPVPATGPPGAEGFLMNGEVRPLGFVAITKTGTRFISVAGAPAR